MYDILIVGGGPAGLTAAIYAKRAGKSVAVFEALSVGGQISKANEVENYPGFKTVSGFDLAMGLYEQAEALGADVIFENVVKVVDNGKTKTITTDSKEYEGKVIIIATGVKSRTLDLQKEALLTGSGVSYCSVCDGAFFKNQTVAVVGGGNSAVDDAYYLAEFCPKVYLIHRSDTFRCEKAVLEKTKQKQNVEFLLNSTVKELLGENMLEGIITIDKDGNERVLNDVKGLFISAGKVPNNKIFEDLVDLDEAGYVIADENCKTKTSGIFVAGDCRTKSIRQLTTATADGSVSALAAIEYLKFLD